MGILKTIQNYFIPEEEEIIFEDDKVNVVQPAAAPAVAESEKQVVGGEPLGRIAADADAQAALRRSKMQVISSGKAQDMRIQIYTPQSFDAVSEIADDLKAKRSAIVNYERVEMSEQRRICDFLNGVCYVLNGEVRRITATMVLYVPDGVEISDIKSVAPAAAPMQY